MDLKTSVIIAIVSLTSFYISEWTLSWTTILAIIGLTTIIKSSKDGLMEVIKINTRYFHSTTTLTEN